MAPFGATDRVVRPLGGEAALTFYAAAPAALGRPFLVALVMALSVSAMIVALGRHPNAAQGMKLSVSAPTTVRRVVRHDDEPVPSLLAALRFDAPPAVLDRGEQAADASLGSAEAFDPEGLVRLGARSLKRGLIETLFSAARVVDSDPALLMAIADKESSFSPTAKARTSSAEGLFQFIDRTWLMVVRQFGAKHGLVAEAAAVKVDADGDPVVADDAMRAKILKMRRDPRLAAIMAAEMLKRDADRIAGRLGRTLSSGEVYLAHFLGPEDAERFLAKVNDEPNAIAAKLLPRPARANRPIFFAASRRRAKGLSVAQVHRKFEEMIQARVERFRGADRIAGLTAYSEASAR
jgi:hypothetical protein